MVVVLGKVKWLGNFVLGDQGLGIAKVPSGSQVSSAAVTRSVAKVFLGSAKTRWVILTKRLTSSWA